MAEEEDDNILRTDRWKEKTNFVPGLVFDEDGKADIPDLRFQVLGGKVFSIQTWRDGSTGRGEMSLEDLGKKLGKNITKEGWYDFDGTYLGLAPEMTE